MNTNFAAMGLNYGVGQNAFTACRPRSTVERMAPPERKRGPQSATHKTMLSLESFEDRQARLAKSVMRVNPESRLGYSDANSRTKLPGRTNEAGTL